MLYAENCYPQVGYKPKNGSYIGAQTPLIPSIPAVHKHGVKLASESCLVPSTDLRTTSGERPIFTDMTRYYNTMQQPVEAQTSGHHQSLAANSSHWQQRAQPRPQVTIPVQQANDELNTPVFDFGNLLPQPDMNASMDDFEDPISFDLVAGMSSQDLEKTLCSSQELDPMFSSTTPFSQNSVSSVKLTMAVADITSDNPTFDLLLPEILNALEDKNDLGLPFDDQISAELEDRPPVKPEPSLTPSPSALVINAPSPDSTSPASVQGAGNDSPPEYYIGSSECESETNLKRPSPSTRAGPSSAKRLRKSIRTEDDNSSIPSSASELKVLENRFRNNEASRKSRMNKRSKDEENEQLLAELEKKHARLLATATSLENIRNEMRAKALARIKSK